MLVLVNRKEKLIFVIPAKSVERIGTYAAAIVPSLPRHTDIKTKKSAEVIDPRPSVGQATENERKWVSRNKRERKKGGVIKKKGKRKGTMYDGLYEYKKYRSQEQKEGRRKVKGG